MVHPWASLQHSITKLLMHVIIKEEIFRICGLYIAWIKSLYKKIILDFLGWVGWFSNIYGKEIWIFHWSFHQQGSRDLLRET